MICYKLTILVSTLLIATVYCQSQVDTANATVIVTTSNNTNTTTPDTTNTTTTSSTTTNSAPNTTVTTTGSNTTTTAVPTSKPTTTTTAPSGAPTFSVKNSDKKYCAILQANITVTANATDNKTLSSVVPRDASVSGSCGKTVDLMTIDWEAVIDNTTSVNVTLTLNITSNTGSDAFQLTRVTVEMLSASGENKSLTANVTLFKSSKGSYYLCADGKTAEAKDLKVMFTDVKLVAFAKQADTTFGGLTANDCKSNPTTDTIVPIAVGCALAAMVLIVLIGYCIGRRRTRPGYQQMSE